MRAGGAIGEALASEQRALVFLQGPLGAGKTTLCRGMLRALGHQGAVKSPTYTLVEPYALPKGQLYHFDLYRTADPEELEFMGIRDYLSGENGHYCLVEWPDRGAGVLPTADMTVRIAITGPGRRLELAAATPIGDNVLRQLSVSLDGVLGENGLG